LEGITFPEDVFKDVEFSGGHTNTIETIINKKAEVGGVAFEHLRDELNEKPHLIMSEQAYKSFHTAQLKSLEKYNPILPISIPTIEALGGGSTRCMMAEIHLIKR
jgi:hypothetical protein